MHSVAPLRASRELSEALELMTKALAILDEADAPGKIGATLDLAISCLSAVVGQDERASPGLQSFMEELKRELSLTSQPEPDQSGPWENP
jgi:hypothetical protein